MEFLIKIVPTIFEEWGFGRNFTWKRSCQRCMLSVRDARGFMVSNYRSFPYLKLIVFENVEHLAITESL